MNREELQARAKTAAHATECDLWAVTPAYILLDFDKDDFCKLIDAIGLEKWVAKVERWQRLQDAMETQEALDRYEHDKARLQEMERERERLQERVSQYEATSRFMRKGA